MSNSSILDQEKFWKVLSFLTDLNEEKQFSKIADELSISNWELNSFVNFLAEVEYPFTVEGKGESRIFHPPKRKPEYKTDFSLLEWLQFQAHFPKMGECEGRVFHDGFKQKLKEIENKFSHSDLFSPAATLESILNKHKPTLLDENDKNTKAILLFLEVAILENCVVDVELEKKSLQMFPHKLVFFDGGLNLVGEEISDKCLMNLDINQIHSANENEEGYKPQYTKIEIDGFIESLQNMSEDRIRLVLKISAQDNFSLNFNNIYIDNPCLFTNPTGDFIWAGTLEPSEAVFEWLCELGPAVEILDPSNFKIQFIKYCEQKLKKLA